MAVVLLALLVAAGPATAAWWWPSQGTWIERAHLARDDADEGGALENPSHWGIHFGSSVDLDGDVLVVGTQFDRHSDGWRTASGDGGDWVYVFERGPGGNWAQVAKLVPDDAGEGDSFAHSVAVDAEAGTIVAGNPAAGKIYIFERADAGTWAQVASFSLPAGAEGPEGWFATSVAVSGDTVVAGYSPEVYLYERLDGAWAEAGTLPGGLDVALEGETLVTSVWDPETDLTEYAIYADAAPGWQEVGRLAPSASFDSVNTVGCTVAINEEQTVVVIGACVDRRVFGVPTEVEVESGDENLAWANGGAIGSAWIYELEDSGWQMTADIPNPTPAPDGDLFGYSVDVSGMRVVIGAPHDTYNGAEDASGAAFVYEKRSGEWLLDGKLRHHDSGPYGGGDWFGSSVAVSGQVIAVGAPFDDQRRDGTPWPVDDDGDIPACVHRELMWGCDEGENAGSAYVFEKAGALTGAPVELAG